MATDLAIHTIVRYEPTLRLIRELSSGELLEVGSAHVGLRGYGLADPGWQVTVVDKGFDNYGQAPEGSGPEASDLVVGDARELPFGDRAFDVTVALDLLEHIAPQDRAQVLGELGRVTRERLVVGCPTGSVALDSDRRLSSSFARRGRPEPGWLSEHLEAGLPEPEELRKGLERFGAVRLFGNENIAAHERLMWLHTRLGWSWPVRAAVRLLRAACARRSRLAARTLWLLRGRDRPPVYRTIAVVDITDD